MIAATQRKGFPLKVAVIATAYDLGSVPVLFDRPHEYARFLAEEDVFYWHDELLVVMPNGFAIYKSTGVSAADAATIDRLHFTAADTGAALVVDAEHAVRALASDHGISTLRA